MNYKKSRIISLFLIIALVLSMAACSQPSPPEETEDPPAEESVYQAGTYTATVQAHNGDLTVEVVFDSTKIVEINILDHTESAGISDLSFDRIPSEVLDKQSLNVDAVSGATVTSRAILEAIEACVVQAGGDVSALKQSDTNNQQGSEDTTLTTDVVVVGAGGAGLAAAASAYQHGADVIVLEKLATIGGSTAYSGGGIAATGTRFQEELGIHDTKESWMELWLERQAFSYSEGLYPDYDVVDRFMDEAIITTEWLVDYIGHAYGSIAGFGMDPVERLHFPVQDAGGPGGAYLTGNIESFLLDKGIQILTETSATELITDASGNVIGVVAEGRDGRVIIEAKKVILATGGYAKNDDMLAEFIPQASGSAELSAAAPGSMGDGQRMAMDIGAATYEEPWVIGLGIGSKFSAGNAFAWDWTKVYVNGQGQRFTNEQQHYAIITNDVFEQENVWMIFDSSEGNQSAIEAIEADLSNPEVAKGETWASLAESMGVSVDNFVETMEAYNLNGNNGEDSLGKQAMFLVSMENAPYYGIRIYGKTMGTFAGVKTDENYQVLREDGSVINNLYATGETANKVLYDQVYMSGSAVQFALTSGRIAAEHAANSLN